MPMRRFRVAEDSMRPTLVPGDEVVATSSRRPEIGDLVVFEHPSRSNFWMVKRCAPPPRPIASDDVWVLSDNLDVTTADSRSLGPLPVAGMFTVVERFDDAMFREAVTLLIDEDPALASQVERHGIPAYWSRPPGFATMVSFILEQQVSLESGASVFRRLEERVGDLTPQAILALEPGHIRASGVTGQKTGYLLDLAGRLAAGTLDLDALADMDTDAARRQLQSVMGIGPWTADVYLLAALGRIDVLPIGDRALQVGAGEALGMSRSPDPAELEVLAEPWRPIRSAAARILWHGYLERRGRAEPLVVDPVL
jgi:DNA-3-methyladenine glycosylase II